MEQSDQVLHEPSILESMPVEVLKVNVHRLCLLLNDSFSRHLIKVERFFFSGILIHELHVLREVRLEVWLIGGQFEAKYQKYYYLP